MDHRAVSEANAINSTRHQVLRSVGGSISLEMQLPKLLWLKKVTLIVVLIRFTWLGGVMVRRWTCDQAVVVLIPGRAAIGLPRST